MQWAVGCWAPMGRACWHKKTGLHQRIPTHFGQQAPLILLQCAMGIYFVRGEPCPSFPDLSDNPITLLEGDPPFVSKVTGSENSPATALLQALTRKFMYFMSNFRPVRKAQKGQMVNVWNYPTSPFPPPPPMQHSTHHVMIPLPDCNKKILPVLKTTHRSGVAAAAAEAPLAWTSSVIYLFPTFLWVKNQGG